MANNQIINGALNYLGNCDHVVEEGISGIWTYRKWANGIAECWGVHSANYTISNTYGNLFYDMLGNVALPSGLFVVSPVVLATRREGGGGITGLVSVSLSANTSYISGYVFDGKSNSTMSVNIAFHAIGRYK